MGRRKIEIKAIKDDRNRSVTFLKRKGGLFKKAHELAVLCSVDVAVIIFGQNKKLYEYSSCDMQETLGRYQYFGPPHEHKGPDDFSGKREGDDDDEDETTPAPEEMQVQQPHAAVAVAVASHLQQPGFQHINHAPSASPPIVHNGLPVIRNGTPQSQASRPTSRNHVRRVSSNLGPQGHATPTPPPPTVQNGYYMANPSIYNPNVHGPVNQARPAQYAQYGQPPNAPPANPSQMHPQHPHGPPVHHPHAPHHFQHVHMVVQQQMGMPPASHAPVQQIPPQPYISEPNRGSLPPAFAPEPQSERTVPVVETAQDASVNTVKSESSQSPPQPRPLSKSQSRSIFTPIDDRGSAHGNQMLKPQLPSESAPDDLPIATISAPEPKRSLSKPAAVDIKAPSRTNSGALPSKRPQLKVQIPSEHSDHGSATGESSSRDSAGNKTATPAKDSHPAGVVLPPPSPSAGVILSAGAQGPPNPFARPPPPGSTGQGTFAGSGTSGGNGSSSSSSSNNNANSNNNNNNNSNHIETPISALPSRFVSDNLLPSPSSFFPEWGFGRSGPDSNLLPSPLTFPTPAIPTGPSFSREDEQEKKRKSPDGGGSAGSADGANKKPKT
ncbi:hypothetical protein N7539_007813 [Penicillium diatomitis]|uniref:MADS-box domain-containing protein n=1 Tax=Penicillium diatomitis TaxID=2819901 RepID=A0A9X0BNB9_9EURO|nr:uncharacterized protein N7539_007813 [Penicillium diatomitis]KAJ5475526.1 hypothetical protein N7539_007813 [Penicillium diatomitis]